MKKRIALIIAALVGLSLLAACSGGASGGGAPQSVQSQAESQSEVIAPGSEAASEAAEEEDMNETNLIYRGKVEQAGEGSLTVSQLPGYNYGQGSIVFHVADETVLELFPIESEGGEDALAALPVDAFVEVEYSGMLTRSLPAQGTALRVTQIAAFSEGIIYNGTIQEVTENENGYSITLLPFEARDGSFENMAILQVPAEALEGGLTIADLIQGAEVSAVSKGIATMSLPPQVPVLALMPYQANEE